MSITSLRRASSLILEKGFKSDSKLVLARTVSMSSDTARDSAAASASDSTSTGTDVTKMTPEEKALEKVKLVSWQAELARFQIQFKLAMVDAGDDMMSLAGVLRETTPLRLYLERELEQTQKNVDEIDRLWPTELKPAVKREISISSRIRKVWAIDQVRMLHERYRCHAIYSLLLPTSIHCPRVPMYVCMYVLVCVYVCIDVFMYLCMYVFMYVSM
jgi:hypothetical protein